MRLAGQAGLEYIKSGRVRVPVYTITQWHSNGDNAVFVQSERASDCRIQKMPPPLHTDEQSVTTLGSGVRDAWPKGDSD